MRINLSLGTGVCVVRWSEERYESRTAVLVIVPAGLRHAPIDSEAVFVVGQFVRFWFENLIPLGVHAPEGAVFVQVEVDPSEKGNPSTPLTAGTLSDLDPGDWRVCTRHIIRAGSASVNFDVALRY